MAERIVLLTSDSPLSRGVYHALTDRFGEVHVIAENAMDRSKILRRRVKKLGGITVLGQVLFMVLILPVLTWSAKKRIRVIKQEYALDDSPMHSLLTKVPSVNSPEVRQIIQEINPDIVVVFGTRVICSTTLHEISAPIVNLHSGVTPRYRGVHGGYWALVEGRPDLVGSTVHLVDRGVDTGDVIGRAVFPITVEDNFATYPYLHLAFGLPVLLDAVQQSLDGRLIAKSHEPEALSVLRTHPTAWGYVIKRVFNGVR